MSFIVLTTHAKERSLKRFGIGGNKLLELAEKAVTEGYSINDAPNKQISCFLQRKIRGKQNIYVYSGYVFIFTSDLVLITTYRMPKFLLMTIA